MPLYDLTLAVRNLRRRPAFTATALLLVALAAAANAAVFSVVRSVVLRPLPYEDPARLVMLWPSAFVNGEDVTFWRDRARSLDSIAASSPGWMMSFAVPGQEPIKVTGARTSGNFFTTLGVNARHGRALRPSDAEPGAAPVVVLSTGLHARYFNGDPAVLGRTVSLDGQTHEIIGVLEPEFEFLEPGTDLWTALPFDPTSKQYRAVFSLAFARLGPNATVEQADAELRALTPEMRRANQKAADWGRDARVVAMQEYVTGDVRPTLLILLAGVGLILLLAAVNLGMLVLSRSLERAREIAVRTALGGTRGRLLQQLLAEQLVLAAAGAAAGALLARLALPLLVRWLPPDMPRLAEIRVDWFVFAVVLSATVLVAVAMAVVPIALATGRRTPLRPLLGERQNTETPSRRRALGSLVTVQVALAVVLSIGAGLMLRSMWNLQRVDPGFSVANVLTFRLQTTSKPLGLGSGTAYFEQVLDRVRTLPGVTKVGAIQHLPMSGYNWTSGVWRPENPPPPGGERPQATWRFTGWDYFDTMGIVLAAGRTFTADDRRDTAAVAIINETLARQEFGSAQAAIGRRLISFSVGQETPAEVVGVIRDVRYQSLDKPAEPELYRPFSQAFMFPMAFVVRTEGDPTAIAAGVRQAAYAADPAIAVAELRPLASLVADTLGRPRLLARLLAVFAVAGLLLSVVGVYGAVAYRVRQREREFGIRQALGAAPAIIARTIARQGVSYAAGGLLMGLPLAFLVVRLMDSVVFGITTRDPLTFTVVSIAVSVSAVLACAVPAWRGARVSPMTTMRGE